MYSAFCHLFSVANYYVRKNAVLISIITLVQHAHYKYKYIAKMRMYEYEYRSVSTILCTAKGTAYVRTQTQQRKTVMMHLLA
jgi:hypothetical protein